MSIRGNCFHFHRSHRTQDKETEFQQIKRAYLVLSDLEKRMTYDDGGEQAVRNKWSGEIFFDEMDFATRITNVSYSDHIFSAVLLVAVLLPSQVMAGDVQF